MIVKKTRFKGLLIIKQKNNTDARGSLRETFNNKKLKKKFVFDYCTTSKGNVLRGFHLQTKFTQSKYVNVISEDAILPGLYHANCCLLDTTFGNTCSLL